VPSTTSNFVKDLVDGEYLLARYELWGVFTGYACADRLAQWDVLAKVTWVNLFKVWLILPEHGVTWRYEATHPVKLEAVFHYYPDFNTPVKHNDDFQHYSLSAGDRFQLTLIIGEAIDYLLERT